MKTWQRLACVAAIAAAGAASSAGAAVISADYQNAGDGLLTVDTATGLEWLDFSASQGASVDGSLAAYPGFSLATGAEVAGLLADLGFNHINGNTSGPVDQSVHYDDLAAGELFLSLMGSTITYYDGAIHQTLGHVQGVSPGTYDMWFFEIRSTAVGSPGTSNYYSQLGNCYQCAASTEANFLVRDAPAAVPEPASWALMLGGFGIAGAALRGARRTAAAA